MKTRGYLLYARPSFWEGVARLVDITGSLNQYNYSASDEEADCRAIESDWEAVGADILSAAKAFQEQFQQQAAR